MSMDNTQMRPAHTLEEDEIDLRELWNTIVKYKKKILIFSLAVTFVAVLYALSIPNMYESKTIILPQEQSKASMGGGLAALAGMAGVDVSGGGGPKVEDSYAALLQNYSFMRAFILKNNLQNRLFANDSDKNYRFALGFRLLYDIKTFSPFSKENLNFAKLSDDKKEALLYELSKKLSEMIQIQADKKTSLLTLSAKNSDAVLARDLVEMFLRDAATYLRDNEMSDNENKIRYYEDALYRTSDVSLKAKLADLESSLIQKKVLAQANPYYNVKMLTKPEVPYFMDKEGPKRALIVVVSFVTSLILAVFGVFFIEFLRNKES